MTECGILLNRHQWETLGHDENQHLFRACKKCGEVEERWVEFTGIGHSHRARTVSFNEAMIKIRTAKRHEEEITESKKQVLAFLSSKPTTEVNQP